MSRIRALWQASLNATRKGFIFSLGSTPITWLSKKVNAVSLSSTEAEYRALVEAALSWKLEDLTPPSERHIFSFRTKDDLRKWHLYADSEYGGLSSASLEIKGSGNETTGIFSGRLSLDVSEDARWAIKRSGFCGMRSTKFGGFLDLDPYDTLAFCVRGDGRCYISTIHTENWVNVPGELEDNTWQAFVFIPKDHWYVAKIPLARYLPTWRGNVLDAKLEMNASRIIGMSLSVNVEGGPQGCVTGPGEFRLEVDWIKALRTI